MDRPAAAGSLAGGLLLLWLLLALLWRSRPDGMTVGDALRLLPDVVRLVRRPGRRPHPPPAAAAAAPAGLPALPGGPGIRRRAGRGPRRHGVVVVAGALRPGVRGAGEEALVRHWPGEPSGLEVVRRLAGLTPGMREPG